jgi:hypothetical protein
MRMKRKMFTLLSLLAVMLVAGFTSCQKDELVVDKESLELKAAGEPVEYNNWDPAGGAVAECAQLGDFMYAYKIDNWDGGDMNDDYLAEFMDGHSNTITILNSDGSIFDWSASNSIGAVIVKAATGANVFLYNPQAFADQGLFGWDNKEVSHTTFCWNPDPDDEEECEWYGETAWGAGPRYVARGNWAMYSPYVADSTVDLIAGQHYLAGTIHFSTVDVDGNVTISIELNEGFRLEEFEGEVIEEAVKIHGYALAPKGNPAPGLFAYKGIDLTMTVPASNFYGIHVNVEREVCPEGE